MESSSMTEQTYRLIMVIFFSWMCIIFACEQVTYWKHLCMNAFVNKICIHLDYIFLEKMRRGF